MSLETEYFECKEDWDECDECYGCGQKVFKYYNMSKRVYFAKCGIVDKICEIKNKRMTWVKNKKRPCGWNAIFEVQGDTDWVVSEKPVNPPPKPFKEIKEETNKQLESYLRSKFAYLKVSRNQVALQEINNIVEKTLLREPRKIYYYPTSKQFMRISHYEKIVDFEKRIFSQPIEDKTLVEVKPISPIKYCKKSLDLDNIKYDRMETIDNLVDDINQINLNEREDLSDDEISEDNEKYTSEEEEAEEEEDGDDDDDCTSVTELDQDQEDDDVYDENYEEDEFLEEPGDDN